MATIYYAPSFYGVTFLIIRKILPIIVYFKFVLYTRSADK
jgi:hypothetical protein